MLRGPRLAARLACLTACGGAGIALAVLAAPQIGGGRARAAEEPAHSAALDDAIIAAAKRHGGPEHLVRRIIMRESKYNAHARNHSFWGLMQISYPTAKSMGFRGTAQELLNPVTNLRYAVPYLANAFVIAGKREDAAVRLYAAGYYNTARSRGVLGILRTADSTPLNGVPDDQPVLAANAVVQPPESQGIFGALFGPGSQPEPRMTQVAAYSADTSQSLAANPVVDSGAPVQNAAAAPAPAGTFDGATANMVATKAGDLAPPKKWTHDGGMTVIARGEQGLDQVAPRDGADAGTSKPSRHRSHKVLAYAALDLPPTSAQAYAAAQGQDPRYAASQAAIAQATSGMAPTDQPTAQAQPVLRAEPVHAVATPATVVARDDTPDAKPAKKRVRHARRKKPPEELTQQASADKPVLRDLPMPGPTER